MITHAAIYIHDPYGWGGGYFADTVHEADKPATSILLGPDGQPVPSARQAIGFDLRPKKERNGE